MIASLRHLELGCIPAMLNSIDIYLGVMLSLNNMDIQSLVAIICN